MAKSRAAISEIRTPDPLSQYNVEPPEKRLRNSSNRLGVAEQFSDESVQRAVRSDLGDGDSVRSA